MRPIGGCVRAATQLQTRLLVAEGAVIFADNHACAVCEGERGRLILLRWECHCDRAGGDLTEPAPVGLAYCHASASDLRNRLIPEFVESLTPMEQP